MLCPCTVKTLPRSGSSVVLAALLASGCGGDLIGPSDAGSVRPLDCSVIGCGESIRLPGLATLSGAEMRAITVYLCRNGTCVMGTPARLPEQPAVGFGCELPPDANGHCVVWNVSPDRHRPRRLRSPPRPTTPPRGRALAARSISASATA